MIRSLIEIVANPTYAIFVFIFFMTFFVGLTFFVYFKWDKKDVAEAAKVPLEDGELK